MGLNYRMLGPVNVARQRRTANGRSYSAVAGQIVTVPSQDGDYLVANGWVLIAPSGPTSARPTGKLGQFPATHGLLFWDETLGQMIVTDGTTWRDPTTGNPV